jgi:hypothetical protein
MNTQLREAVRNDNNYIESVARQDKHHVEAALKDEGADTVVRICLWRKR